MVVTTHLLWVDLETTGTDEGVDGIVEIAAILTPVDDLDHPVLSYQAVVWPGDSAMARLDQNEFVRNMHKTSGLYDLIVDGCDPEEAADDLVNLLNQHRIREHQVMIAGSGVAHFDRRFIRRHMPQLDAWLSYPMMDVGVLRRAWSMWGGSLDGYPEDGKTHRALDDITYHLEEARWFANKISTYDDWKIH